MSRDGFIYIGRTGIGTTYAFRREILKVGTIKAIELHGKNLATEELDILELISIEGPKWVPYKRIIEVIQEHEKQDEWVEHAEALANKNTQTIWTMKRE
jgi:hypothetical protein